MYIIYLKDIFCTFNLRPVSGGMSHIFVLVVQLMRNIDFQKTETTNNRIFYGQLVIKLYATILTFSFLVFSGGIKWEH